MKSYGTIRGSDLNDWNNVTQNIHGYRRTILLENAHFPKFSNRLILYLIFLYYPSLNYSVYEDYQSQIKNNE